ncbi:MAG: hypothetical protein ACO3GP_07735 [Candidatus Limnocylindrus sp.]
MNKFISHLKQPSTFRGLAVLGGLAGLSLSPAHWEAIGSAVAAIIAAIEIFRDERK